MTLPDVAQGKRERRELAALLERLNVNYPRGTHKLAELLFAHGVRIADPARAALASGPDAGAGAGGGTE